MQEVWASSWVRTIPWRRVQHPHFTILVWRIPWTEEPGRLQSMGSQRVRHDWGELTCRHEERFSVITLGMLAFSVFSSASFKKINPSSLSFCSAYSIWRWWGWRLSWWPNSTQWIHHVVQKSVMHMCVFMWKSSSKAQNVLDIFVPSASSLPQYLLFKTQCARIT